MIDYDDMERTLREAERELTTEEEQHHAVMEKMLAEDLERRGKVFDDFNHDRCLNRLEQLRASIDEEIEQSYRNHDQADRDHNTAWQNLVSMFLAFLLHFGGYPLLFAMFGGYIEAWLPMVILGFIWFFFTIRFAKKVLDEFVDYRVRTSKGRASELIEANKILTFEKQRSYELLRINKLKEARKQLEKFETKINRQGGLTDEEFRAMEHAGRPNIPKNAYRRYTVSLFEYIKYLVTGEAVL